jgi:hypothetical protein
MNHTRKAENRPLDKILGRRSAIGLSFAPKAYARGHACQLRGGDPKNICVEAVSVNNVNPAFAQERAKPPKLFDHVSVIEAGQRKLGNRTDTKLFCLGKQRACATQASEVHSKASAFYQQPRQQHELAFGPARLEAVEQ